MGRTPGRRYSPGAVRSRPPPSSTRRRATGVAAAAGSQPGLGRADQSLSRVGSAVKARPLGDVEVEPVGRRQQPLVVERGARRARPANGGAHLAPPWRRTRAWAPRCGHRGSGRAWPRRRRGSTTPGTPRRALCQGAGGSTPRRHRHRAARTFRCRALCAAGPAISAPAPRAPGDGRGCPEPGPRAHPASRNPDPSGTARRRRWRCLSGGPAAPPRRRAAPPRRTLEGGSSDAGGPRGARGGRCASAPRGGGLTAPRFARREFSGRY